MSGGDRTGTVVLSIDLELDLEHYHDQLRATFGRSAIAACRFDAGREDSRHLGGCRSHALGRQRIDPGCRLRARDCRLGRPGVARTGLRPRAAVARELARRFSAPRRAGISVSTLTLRNVEQVLDLDLLIEHGVTAVCGPAGRATHAGPQARSAANPLWTVAAADRLEAADPRRDGRRRPSGRFAMRLSGRFGSGRCCTCGWTLCG